MKVLLCVSKIIRIELEHSQNGFILFSWKLKTVFLLYAWIFFLFRRENFDLEMRFYFEIKTWFQIKFARGLLCGAGGVPFPILTGRLDVYSNNRDALNVKTKKPNYIVNN